MPMRKKNLKALKPVYTEKTYEGVVDEMHFPVGVFIHVPGNAPKPLPPRNDLNNHSPSGLAWGYMGSGPSQLALAILADALGDDRKALRLYQTYKAEIIAHLKQDEGFVLPVSEVLMAIKHIEQTSGEAA